MGLTNIMSCPHCGKNVTVGTKFCSHCGQKLNVEEVTEPYLIFTPEYFKEEEKKLEKTEESRELETYIRVPETRLPAKRAKPRHASHLSTRMKLPIIAVIVFTLFLVGYEGYVVFENYFVPDTKLDLAKNITCEFTGRNGVGTVVNQKENYEYDGTNSNITKFIKTCTLEIDKKENLSNGDKITFTVKYKEDEADRYHVDVINNKKTMTVENLVETYSDASDIPESILQSLESGANERIKELLDTNHESWSSTIVKAYFGKNHEDSMNDSVFYIYRIESPFQFWIFGETNYVVVSTSGIATDFNDTQHSWDANYIKNDYGNITNEDEAIYQFTNTYTSYTLSEIS